MREEFPNKRPGDSLAAAHVNALSRVCGRFGRSKPGSNLYGHHGDSFVSTSAFPPFAQARLEVTSVDDNTEGLYLVRPRWFSSIGADTWVTDDDDNQKDLDCRDFGASCRLLLGEKVTAYWDGQRQAFLPISMPTYRKAVADTTIAPDGSGYATVKANNLLTTWHPVVWLDHMHNNEAVEAGAEIRIEFYPDQDDGIGQWSITNANCG